MLFQLTAFIENINKQIYQGEIMKENKVNAKMNVWKVVSIVSIILFGLVIAGSFIKMYISEPIVEPLYDPVDQLNYMKPISASTMEQRDYALDIVEKELRNKGDEWINYEIFIDSHIRKFEAEGVSKSVIVVYLFKENTTRQIYLIDIDSGEVVMYAGTEFYGWMNDYYTSWFNKEFKEYSTIRANKADVNDNDR